MKNVLLHFALLCACVCIFGCGNGGDSLPGTPGLSTTRSFNNIQATMSLRDAVYAAGTDVPIKITLTNTGSQTVTLQYFDCGPSIDVLPQGSNTGIYENGFFCGGAVTLTLQPGETKEYALEWTKTQDNQGDTVSPGIYVIVPQISGYFNGEKQLRSISLDSLPVQVR